jgi:hypothetical protein
MALEVSLQIQYKNETNPTGSTNANIIEDMCLEIPLDRDVDPESELSTGNETSIVAVISKNSRILGSTLR